jgi:hypothetical protein
MLLQVDLTCGCLSHTLRHLDNATLRVTASSAFHSCRWTPLMICIRLATIVGTWRPCLGEFPLPPLATNMLFHNFFFAFPSLPFLYFWAFCFMYLLHVPCNCYLTGVWVGFIRTLSTPLTAFTGGMGSWHPCQESIGPCHSFDILPLVACFLWCLLLSCSTLICSF